MALYAWNGSSWILAPQKKVWNGSSWVEVKGAKVWNGSAWKEFLNASITTGSYSLYSPGGKGVEYYTTSYSGFSLYGVNSSGQYGSVEGSIRDKTVTECYWSTTVYEVSPQDWSFFASVSGNLSGTSYSVLHDGAVITNAKAGTYNSGQNVTYWQWQSLSGDTVPTTNPFGSDGTIHNVQLI